MKNKSQTIDAYKATAISAHGSSNIKSSWRFGLPQYKFDIKDSMVEKI